jgi:hypothetical protein
MARLGLAISKPDEGRQHVELDVRLPGAERIDEAAAFDNVGGQ